jgi:YD repeat-containing protein
VHIDYDRAGRITKKTSPLGQTNTYLYDPFGSLISSKEAGYLKKEWVYDPMGRCIEECEIDTEGIRRSTHFSYDAKGRLISKVDPQLNTTYQTYDSKGRCIQSILPSVEDEQGLSYCPRITYDYDSYGNLSRTTTPSGASTCTDYTALRKPISITHPDGGRTQHIYANNETRLKTTHPDGTDEHFVYDHLKRMIKKTVVGCDGQVLEEESWNYNTLHLLSHTDPLGLTTYYTYDGMGRLIMEKAEESCIYYTYDSLGFLEKKIDNDTTYMTIHDAQGRLIKQWVEDQNGRQEELMESFYDAENRKIQRY